MTVPRTDPPSRWLFAAAVLLDMLIVALFLVVIAVVITGGGVFHLGSMRIRARSADNPASILGTLLVLRYVLEHRLAAGGPRQSLFAAMIRRGASWLSDVGSGVGSISRSPLTLVSLLAAATFAIKVLIAWSSPGFFSGDDVEIHEMSIGALLGKRWSVWELRSAFFPMTFVYPAQWLAYSAGADGPGALVLAGRASVALLSSAALPLTWLAARRLAPAEPQLAGVAVIFLAVNKLFISFGSTELPRPVSSVFVLGAFVLSLRPAITAAAVSGALLGIAIAFRFSEIAFVAAAVGPLALARDWPRAICVALSAVIGAAAVTAVADLLYWGSPLSSALAAIDYTLIERRSSRGYEPAWEYLRIVSAWSTPVMVALAVAGSSRRRPDSWWLWTPIAVLSALPHKESRYLIPVVPFLSIAAARGLVRAIHWAHAASESGRVRRWTLELLAPMLILSLLHDAGGWRLRRANEGIRLAHFLRAAGGAGIAAEDFWTLGGRPYLWRQEPLLNLDPAVLGDRSTLDELLAGKQWLAIHPRSAAAGGDALVQSLGFHRDAGWRGEDYVLYRRRAPE